MPRRPLATAVAFSLLLGIAAPPVQAIDNHWTGATSIDWATAGNWTEMPAADSNVIIDTVAPHDTVLAQINASINQLTVGDSGRGALTIYGMGTLTVTGAQDYGVGLLIGHAAGSGGSVTVTGAGSILTVGEGVTVGDNGHGALSVLAGGVANLALTSSSYAETYVGFGFPGDGINGSGDILVDGSGSTMHYAGGMNVVNGTLTASNGAHLDSTARDGSGWQDVIGVGSVAGSADSINRTYALDGVGVATISGAGSSWHSVNGLQMGYGGTGTLSVLDGAAASFAGQVRIGITNTTYDLMRDPETHKLVSTAVGSKQGKGTLVVSGQGSTLDVSASGSLGQGDLQVGSGGDGSMRVDDHAQVTTAGMLYVGSGGPGNLDISSGGSVVVHGTQDGYVGAIVGEGDGGLGQVSVDGAGSMLTVDGATFIGSSSQGSLAVSGGGAANLALNDAYTEVLVGYGFYGRHDDSAQGSGSLTIDGTGSKVTYAGGMNVQNGTLAISNGASLVSTTRDSIYWVDAIGFGQASTSAVSVNTLYPLSGTADATVSGSGTTWNSVNLLGVGVGGTGMLSILDGAGATFAGRIKIGDVSQTFDTLTDGSESLAGTRNGTGTVLVSGPGSSLSVTPREGVAAGVVLVATGGTGTLSVGDGGSVTAPGGITVGTHGRLVIGDLDGDGNAKAPGVLNTPTVELAAAGPDSALIFEHSADEAADYRFAAAVSGAGDIDVLSGFTKLTGDSSEFAGQTTVDNGATLSVDGSLGGDVSVLAGGRLQGTGTINNATISGILAPGNSPGTLHVGGDLTLLSGAVYEAQIDPATGQSDSVQVAGDITIESGVTLSVENLGSQPLTPGTAINLLESTGGGTVEGEFDNTEGAITDFMGYGVSYEDGKVMVGVTRSDVSFASVGDSAATRALGAALDGVSVDDALGTLLFNQITSAEQAATAFHAMAGTLHADVRRSMLDESRLTRDAIGERLQLAEEGNGVSWWVHALGNWGNTDAHNGLHEAHTDTSGLLTGVDMGVGSNSRLGVAAGWSHTSHDMGPNDTAKWNDTHLAFYGRSTIGQLHLGYGVAFSWHSIDTHRAFQIGTVPQRLASESRARSDQLFLDAGYRIGDGAKGYIEPYVAFAHARVHSNTVHESGAATALVIDAGDDRATFSSLGARWMAGSSQVRWYGTLAWRHVFGFDTSTVQARFADSGGAFAVQGLRTSSNAAQVSLGADFALGQRAHLAFGYEGLISSASTDNGARVQLSVDF